MAEEKFSRLRRLPPYVFAVVNDLKMRLRRQNVDIVDLGMGNPDLATPQHIVDKLVEASHKPVNHRYSVSRGVPNLRKAICDWYRRRYDVSLDPDTEAIATMGAKEGLSHLALAMLDPGDVVFATDPAYPIHPFSATRQTWPQPKLLIISYPNNPTTDVVELSFFEKIVDFAKEHNIYVVHDLAYADLVFDGYEAPSFLQAKGAKDVGVEFFSMSKSYSMAGWRMGFCAGNREMVHALTRIKSYLDYGIFQPIQIASIVALNGPQDCVRQIADTYKQRRDVLIDGLKRIGWEIEPPKATMFVWARIPEPFRHMGSVEFAKLLLQEGHVAVSPGLGFGNYGDDHVRFALIENAHRTNQAIRGIKNVLSGGGCDNT